MPVKIANQKKVIAALNKALAWELRASAMYAHYAAYVKGLESLHLAPLFKREAGESIGHADKVRTMIAELGGQAVTDRDPTPILHTEDPRQMVQEALKTERKAAQHYSAIVPMAKAYYPHFHTLVHIQKEEMDAVVEFENLLAV
ncbi:MAG: ferritin-like domain-containing protein [Gemmatimonadetes bacterium]|nr:ferritin-like domain-containing protein [Gemmatimonadota bacterium]